MDEKPDLGPALRRFRVVAWIVSVLLIALMFVAMPVKYIGGDDSLVGLVSPVHGLGYMVYLVLGFELARRANWSIWPRTILLLLAGTVPVLSFYGERWATRTVAAEAQTIADDTDAATQTGADEPAEAADTTRS